MEKRLQMTAENLQAIREGRKTQTRRVTKPQPSECKSCLIYPEFWDTASMWVDWSKRIYARYQVGDECWIPETWAEIGWWEGDVPVHTIEGNHIIYKAECPDFRYLDSEGGQRYTKDGWEASIWKSPRFMPKKYAREWVRITGVRAERLQDISEEDAIAEGVDCIKDSIGNGYRDYSIKEEDLYMKYARGSFYTLWNSINKEYHWSSNPWVWVYDFERIER